METKPHEHVFAYKGLEHERAERVKSDSKIGAPGYWIYRHFDVFFCQLCLEERAVIRSDGDLNRLPNSAPRPRKPKASEASEETLARASAG